LLHEIWLGGSNMYLVSHGHVTYCIGDAVRDSVVLQEQELHRAQYCYQILQII